MSSPRDLRISTYSWNSAAIKINRGLTAQEEQEIAKSDYSSMLYMNSPVTGFFADFLVPILEEIQQDKPDIIFFANQESMKPGDYLHSDVLPRIMPNRGYRLLKRTRLMGVGVATYKAAITSGSLLFRGLRSSIYVTQEIYNAVETAEVKDREIFGDYFQLSHTVDNALTRGKGAIASYVRIPNYGLLCLINTHFPFNAQSLKDYMKSGSSFIRKAAVLNSDATMCRIYDDLVLRPAREQGDKYSPSHVIVAGDLNYRVTVHAPQENTIAKIFSLPSHYSDMYYKYDELRQSIKAGNVPTFLEGINNQGPKFMPSCKMMKQRQPGAIRLDNYNVGKDNQRYPSWCDRVIYLSSSSQPMKCLKYDRFDYGSMIHSDHAGVMSVNAVPYQPDRILN